MHWQRWLWLPLLAFLSHTSLPAASTTVRYEIKISSRLPGMVQVHLVLDTQGAASIPLILPEGPVSGRQASAGATRTVSDFQVTNPRGKALPFERTGIRYWVVHTQGARTIHIDYTVSQLVVGQERTQAVWFQPADSLVYWKGSSPESVRIRYILPKGWKPATDLKPIGSNQTFEAPTLEALFDSPALLGRLHRTDLKVRGVLFSVVTNERPRFDMRKLTPRLKRMILYQFDLFGVKPFERYVFFLLHREDRTSSFYAAHRSCSVHAFPTSLLDHGGYGSRFQGRHLQRFALHLFSAWNTYYIHPLHQEDSTLAPPSRSRARWFTSGVSEYYALRTLYMTGLIDLDTFLDRIGDTLADLESSLDYGRSSVAQSSWDHVIGKRDRCWTSPTFTSSGLLIGLLLDLEIRRVSRGQKSLDDVMKFLGWWFGKKNTGYNDNVDLEKAVSTVAEYDFSGFFRQHVEGPDRLPVDAVLSEAGFDVERKERGRPSRFLFLRHLSRTGLQTRTGRLTTVLDSNCLFQAGLRSGDRLLTIHDLDVRDHKNLESLSRALFTSWRSGSHADHVSVTYRRNNKTLKTDVKLPSYSRKTTSITPASGRKHPHPGYLKGWLDPRWPPDSPPIGGPPRPNRKPMGSGGPGGGKR